MKKSLISDSRTVKIIKALPNAKEQVAIIRIIEKVQKIMN